MGMSVELVPGCLARTACPPSGLYRFRLKGHLLRIGLSLKETSRSWVSFKETNVRSHLDSP